jgi:hypothetical protein
LRTIVGPQTGPPAEKQARRKRTPNQLRQPATSQKTSRCRLLKNNAANEDINCRQKTGLGNFQSPLLHR